MSVRRLVRTWETFWFTPVSPVPVALYRILLGLVVLHYAWRLTPECLLWLGHSGLLSLETVRAASSPYTMHIIGGWLPATDASVLTLFTLFLASAVTMTLGLYTRASAGLVYLSLLAFQNRNPHIISSADQLMRLCVLWVVFSESGAAMSLDRLRRIARGRESGPPAPRSPLGQRLVQCQLAVVYFSTVFWKLFKSSEAWLDGTALYYAVRLERLQRFSLPSFLDQMWFYQLMSVGTLVIESALWSFIWLPRYRYPVLLSGVALHLGIEYLMNIPLFSTAILTMYVTFISPAHLTRLMKAVRRLIARVAGAAVPVWYDGDCELCLRCARIIRALDLFGRIRVVNFRQPGTRARWQGVDHQRAEGELLVRTTRGRWYGGFLAFRWMAWRLPLGWGIAPWLYVPGIAWLGQRVYAWAARHHDLFFGKTCEAGACRVHAET